MQSNANLYHFFFYGYGSAAAESSFLGRTWLMKAKDTIQSTLSEEKGENRSFV
jgi:hypothetical protein